MWISSLLPVTDPGGGDQGSPKKPHQTLSSSKVAPRKGAGSSTTPSKLAASHRAAPHDHDDNKLHGFEDGGRSSGAAAAAAAAGRCFPGASQTWYSLTIGTCLGLLLFLVLINNPIKLGRGAFWRYFKPAIEGSSSAAPVPLDPADGNPGQLRRVLLQHAPEHSETSMSAASAIPAQGAASLPEQQSVTRSRLPGRRPPRISSLGNRPSGPRLPHPLFGRHGLSRTHHEPPLQQHSNGPQGLQTPSSGETQQQQGQQQGSRGAAAAGSSSGSRAAPASAASAGTATAAAASSGGTTPAAQGSGSTPGWLRELLLKYLDNNGTTATSSASAAPPNGAIRASPAGASGVAAVNGTAAADIVAARAAMMMQRIEAQRQREELRLRLLPEIYKPRTPNLVSVSPNLPLQDLGAETFGCWNRSYMRDGCPQAFMNGSVISVGYNNSGPYMAYMEPARSLRQQVHAAHIIALPNGELLATWFDGLEGQAGVGIVVSRLPLGGYGKRAWTKPVMVSLDPTRSAQNPVLYYDKADGTVFLFHTSQRAMMGQGTSNVQWLKSRNLGVSWTQPQVLFRRPGVFIRNSILEGVDGEWLLPMYYTPTGYEGYSAHFCTMRRSSDQGMTWREIKISSPGQYLAQPTTVRLSFEPPLLVTWMRDRRNLFIYMSKSDDDGRTWTTPRRTRLPNNNSGIQALVLASGAVAMVFNNKGGVLDRYPITIALSYDGGETWPFLRDLDQEPLHLAYPALAQTSDGLIHVVYSYHREAIKYVAVTEDWIKAGTTRGIFKGDKVTAGLAVQLQANKQ